MRLCALRCRVLWFSYVFFSKTSPRCKHKLCQKLWQHIGSLMQFVSISKNTLCTNVDHMCFAKSKQGARIKRRSEELIDTVEHLETCMRLVKYAKPTYTTTMKHCCLSTVSCKAWYIEVLLWQAGKRWGVKEEWKKSEEEWRGEDRKRLDEERRTWARRRDGERAVSVMNQAGLKCSCLAKARTKLWKRKLAGRTKLKPRHLDFYIQMFSNLKL